MKQHPKLFVFLTFFVFACNVILAKPPSVPAATYYVTPPPTGSDSNSGNSSSPFATLQKAADSVTPGDTVIVNNGHYQGFRLATSGTTQNRIIFSCSGREAIIDTPASGGYGIFLSNVSYVTIQGFIVQDMTYMGIAHRNASPDAPVHGLIIRGNTVIRSKSEGMYFSEISDSLIENNEVDHGGLDRNHCIYMANAGTGATTIRGNILHHCGLAGIHFNGDISIGGDGIISGLIIEGNTIYNNGLNGLNMDGVQDTTIRNNIFYKNSVNAIRAFKIDAAEGPKNLTIVNNTIHVPRDDGSWAVRITSEGGGNTVFNNILINEAWGGSIAIDSDSYGFSSANNIVVDRFTPDRDDTILTLKEWQALGYDRGSFLATLDSLFVDYQSGDYRLSQNSPAKDAGLSSFAGIAAPSTDKTATPRPQGTAVDIGAYELFSSPTPVITAHLPFISLLLAEETASSGDNEL